MILQPMASPALLPMIIMLFRLVVVPSAGRTLKSLTGLGSETDA